MNALASEAFIDRAGRALIGAASAPAKVPMRLTTAWSRETLIGHARASPTGGPSESFTASVVAVDPNLVSGRPASGKLAAVKVKHPKGKKKKKG
jgi:hypothetical protein